MKPPLDSLGPCGQPTVYEHALRSAQQTIDGLRARVKELEGELVKKTYEAHLADGHDTHAILRTSRDFPPHDIVVLPHAANPAQRVEVVPPEHEI